jgi:hypothetical protein
MYFHWQGFKKGTADYSLYIKPKGNNLLIIIVYVDDTIFGSNTELMNQRFVIVMRKEFEMSLLGNCSFFLGLQMHQLERGIFISQSKYFKEIFKMFGMK